MFPTEQFWNEKFQAEDYFYGIEPNAFLKEKAHVFPEKGKIISLGEGEGRNAVFVAKNGFEVTASDASSKGLEKIAKLAETSGLSMNTRYEDIVKGNWDEKKWDGIYNIFCHLMKGDRFTVYEKIKKSLVSGGVFLTEMFSVDQLNYKSGGPPVLEMLLTVEELSDAFQDFEILYSEKEVYDLDEGRHKGTGSVIRFIARKR